MTQTTLQDPVLLGNRLKAARVSAQLTQEEAASGIGVVRTTIVAIEQGSRPVKSDELVKLADLYKVKLRDLLGDEEEPDISLVPQFRHDLRKPKESRHVASLEAVRLLERLVRNYLKLERTLGKPLTWNYPSEYALTPGGGEEQVEEMAMAERARLGLGLGPIQDLLSLLETQVGLRIFTRPTPSGVSGLYSFHSSAGGCLLVNSMHPAGRQAWTAAHEYFHFLTKRNEAEVLAETPGKSASERAADHFAQAFLMPSVSVRQQFDSFCKAAGKFPPASLFYLAHIFGVSGEAMAKRLEHLKLIKAGTWESLKARGLKVGDARIKLGLPESPPHVNAPLRFLALAVDGYLDGRFSEGELAQLLVVDRLTVREWVDEFALEPEGRRA